MQKKVNRTANALKSVYSVKCNNTYFSCPIKSFDMCAGTDEKQCLPNFPQPSCSVGKYSETSAIRLSLYPLSS